MPSHDQTILTGESTAGLGTLTIRHPPGTFAPTPATLIALEAIGKHRNLLVGFGLDWGSGAGCLAIAAARIPSVENIVGLEIAEANVVVARANAVNNGVSDKVEFLHADSYSPYSDVDRAKLKLRSGTITFILANPPTSEGDDGFGFRKVVLRGAREYLAPGGVVFLSVSYQYGVARIERLCQEIAGFAYRGVLASTDWVPFDLHRLELLHCLHLYAEEERRGGLEYTFQNPKADSASPRSAQEALAFYEKTGQSPLSKWQTHLYVYQDSPA